MNTALAIFLGGGAGSLARFGISRLLVGHDGSVQFPWGTVAANVLACIVLALVMLKWHDQLATRSAAIPLLAVGFCGGFSTFSTFSLENYLLLKQGAVATASLNVAVSITACLAVFYIIAGRT